MANIGYLIPSEPEPEEDVCIRVYVPNDSLYIAAFWGAYEHFTAWLAWERDAAKRGKLAASRWKTSFIRSRDEWLNSCQGCGLMDVRQSDETPCVLEKSTVCGEWEQFALLSECVPEMRIVGSEEGLTIEQLTEGGWIRTSTGTDPYQDRFDGPFLPAWFSPPVGQEGNCLATANAVAYTSWAVDEIATKMSGGINILSLISTLIGMITAFAEFVWVGELAQGYLQVFEFIGAIWDDVLSYNVIGALGEMLICRYEADGSMTRESWEVLIADITAYRAPLTDNYKRVKWQLIKLYFQALGPVGMSRVAAAANITEADCGEFDCGWFVTFDFTQDSYGWVVEVLLDHDAGEYVAGIGWRGVYTGTLGVNGAYRVWVRSPVKASTLYYKAMADFTFSDAGRDYNYLYAGILVDGSFVGYQINTGDVVAPPPMPDGNLLGSAEFTGTQLGLRIASIDLDNTQPSQGDVGGLTLTRVRFWGRGDNPWG